LGLGYPLLEFGEDGLELVTMTLDLLDLEIDAIHLGLGGCCSLPCRFGILFGSPKLTFGCIPFGLAVGRR
jgi:hypothetical protein